MARAVEVGTVADFSSSASAQAHVERAAAGERRPSAAELLGTPDALLTRSDLRMLGLERRAVDAVFRKRGGRRTHTTRRGGIVNDTNGQMTKAERDELARLVRRREKLAKADADRVAAERLEDFEQELASIYKPDGPVWNQLQREAAEIVATADEELAVRCRAHGIPESCRPRLSLAWYGRGENGAAMRRVELRAVAKSRVDAAAKATKVAIERWSVEIQTELVAGGLVSGEARAFLASLPTAEALIAAAPSVAELEAELAGEPRRPDWDDLPF